jgi:hypothetical protein
MSNIVVICGALVLLLILGGRCELSINSSVQDPNKIEKKEPDVKVTRTIELGDFLKAISKVESNHDDKAIGDKGKSIGRYQISKAYWQDACDHNTVLGKKHNGNNKWEDCHQDYYATQIVLSYFDRYAPNHVKDKNWEMLARLHNGGPSVLKAKPPKKIWDNTTIYWDKIKKEL